MPVTLGRLLAAATALLALCDCGPTSKCGPTQAVVTSVVDGDTITVESGSCGADSDCRAGALFATQSCVSGKCSTKVRYLLVDTPETTSGKNDCYGTQAADFNRSKVEGRTVQLRYDEAECADRYSRLLAYVTVDGLELNKALVQQGYACVLYLAPGGQARHEEFLTYESEAKTARTGMWGACTVIPCSM